MILRCKSKLLIFLNPLLFLILVFSRATIKRFYYLLLFFLYKHIKHYIFIYLCNYGLLCDPMLIVILLPIIIK